MGRGVCGRLTPEAIDQLWIRMRAGHAPKPTAVSSACLLRRCVTICIGVAGSDPCHGTDLQVVSRW